MAVQKLYCYVDETGQDTKGESFIVSVVVTQEDREALVQLVERVEQESGKKATKWHKTAKEIKQRFVEQLFQNQTLQRKLYYSSYRNTSTYQELTVLTIAAAIHVAKRQSNYKASVFIDGLQKSEVMAVSAKLRKIGVSTEKVRGVRDESHALIRLADAMAGFIREYEEGREYAVVLYQIAIRKGILVEV
jgi:glycine cleavage system pyridoxal-binding protein P